MAKAVKRPSRKRERRIRRREVGPPSPTPIDPENPLRLPVDPKTGLIDWDEVRRRGPQRVPEEWLRDLPTDEEWWARYCPGTFKNTAEHNEASNRLQYYLDVREGRIKGRYDEKGRLLVPREQKPEPKPQPTPEASEKPEASDEGKQEARAIASLIKAFPPNGQIPLNWSVKRAREKALPYLDRDPDKGPPHAETYRRVIKKLGRAS
jgi:hypothetical protein